MSEFEPNIRHIAIPITKTYHPGETLASGTVISDKYPSTPTIDQVPVCLNREVSNCIHCPRSNDPTLCQVPLKQC